MCYRLIAVNNITDTVCDMIQYLNFKHISRRLTVTPADKMANMSLGMKRLFEVNALQGVAHQALSLILGFSRCYQV